MASFVRTAGSILRGFGQAMDQAGVRIQGKNAYVEKLPVSTRTVLVAGKQPDTANAAFVGPNASLVGEVSLGKDSSVFYGAVMRGDKAAITVGEMSTVGDNSVIGSQKPTSIGSCVLIGGGCTVGGCTIEDGAHIGGGSVLSDGVVVGSRAVLAPGSFVAADTHVPAKQLWAGSPAAYVRDVDSFESEQLLTAAGGYSWLGQLHGNECAKSPAQVEAETAAYEDEWGRGDEYAATILNYVEPEPMPKLAGFLYALQLRTYFELDTVVKPGEESVIYIDVKDDAQEIMDDVLVQASNTSDAGDDKKSYWFVNN